jgi:hypothetical protein
MTLVAILLALAVVASVYNSMGEIGPPLAGRLAFVLAAIIGLVALA